MVSISYPARRPLADAIDKAQKPDCRYAYAAMGVLAVPALVASAVADGGGIDMATKKASLPRSLNHGHGAGKAVPKGMPTELHPERLSHSEPHPVFIATLDDLAAGKLLGAAKQTGWRDLLVQHDAAVAEAEIGARRSGARGAKGTKLEFLGLTHGPFTDATIKALSAAERLPKVAKADYELRLLKVPAIYLIALWLRGKEGDILIPMGDPPSGLKKNKAYTEAGVLRALRDVVVRTRQFQQAYDEQKRKRRGK